jgi:outer membrane receptor protein involved in Fe transport
VTKRTLVAAEMERSAGTHGDALLSLQNLPGVARPPPFSGQLVVRGSAPQDTNVFIDGTNVPLVYHFGGLSSVVPTELLKKIDFYPGNYSAQYGRGMGGIVDVGLRDPKKDGYHGLAEVSILGARALVEGPIGSGWTFLASGQRSWLDLLVTPVLKATHASTTAMPRFFGWISYTLSRSERRDVPSEPYALYQFDQTHVLTILGSYKLGRGWTLGGRFRLTSGDLYTPRDTGAYDATVGSQLAVSSFPPYGSRMPLFEQLDIRLDRSFTRGPVRGSAFIDIQNVYFANNPMGLSYNYNYTKSTPINGLPLLPITGVRFEL